MTKGKHAKLIEKLGGNMNESAGRPQVEDRFEGFLPSGSASGEMQLDRIAEDPNQPRKTFDQQALLDLAENLKTHGVQQAIQLRWSEENQHWLIVYGHRRYRAAKLAGLTTIPCTFTDENIDEPTLRVRQLVENCQRENLAPIELARGLQALAELTGWSNQRMGQELGLDRTMIGRYLNLLNLSDDVKQMVQSKQLAPSVASDMAQIKDAAKQIQLGQEITANKLNRQQAKQRIRMIADEEGTAKVRPSQAVTSKELLCQTVNLTIYRNPKASNFEIRKELLAVAEQIDVERLED